MAIVCPACGKDGAVRGTLVSGPLWYFRPSGVKGTLLSDAQTEAFSYACVGCGVVTTFVDPDQLSKLLEAEKKRRDGTK